MPAPTWLRPGLDLDFVHEERPRGLRDLLGKRGPWVELYVQWYEAHVDDGAELRHVLLMVRTFARTGVLRDAIAAVPGTARKHVRAWDARIGRDFRDACGDVRTWLTAEDDEARRQLEREGATGSGLLFGRGVPAEAVKERRRANTAREIRSAQAERDSRDPDGLLRNLFHIEAHLAAYTQAVKPKSKQLYGLYSQKAWGGDTSVVDRFAAAYGGLNTAEAEVRRVGEDLRRTLAEAASQWDREIRSGEADMARTDPSAEVVVAQAEVIRAWTQYLDACAVFAEALSAVSAQIVAWARKDTADKIRKNFASAHPNVAGAQLLVNLAVTALSALIQALGTLASAVPAITAVTVAASSGLTAALDLIERLVASLIADTDARDPGTVRRHIGREYQVAPSGEGPARAAEEADYAANVVGQAVGPALGWVAERTGSPSGIAAQAIPVAGMLWRFGAMVVRFEELVNRRILQDTGERQALERLLEQAYAHLSSVAPDLDVRVIDARTEEGWAQVEVNGQDGELVGGRFSPSERSGSLEAALRNWMKADPPTHVALPAAGRPVRRYVLQHADGTLVAPEGVADAVITYREKSGGFVCEAYASGYGVGREAGRDRWHVTFSLTAEGVAHVIEDRTDFVYLELYTRDQALVVRAEDARGAGALLRETGGGADRGVLEDLHALTGPGKLSLKGRRLRYPDGSPVTDDITGLGERLREIRIELEELELGDSMDLTGLGLEEMRVRIGHWREATGMFDLAARCTDDVERWQVISGLLQQDGLRPQVREQFLEFLVLGDLFDAYATVDAVFRHVLDHSGTAPLQDGSPLQSETLADLDAEQQHLAHRIWVCLFGEGAAPVAD
ncbi:hypothetical protein [Streptomyces sp. NPDC059918]|uniref:hypothetical protein n=1 Tax=unclassified Streptomyces TaxID=2593676 RepID=UPI003658E7BF